MHKPAFVLIAAIAAVALAACGGGKSNSTTQTSPAASPAMTPKNPKLGKPNATKPMPVAHMTPKNPNLGKPEAGNVAMSSAAALQAGSKVYTTNCSSCHQATGKGQPGVFPPLAGNTVVTGPADKVITIVKNGLSGKISVKGATYNGQMPAWKGTLSDSDIAAVITYVRGSWGNKASAVTAKQVSAVK